MLGFHISPNDCELKGQALLNICFCFMIVKIVNRICPESSKGYCTVTYMEFDVAHHSSLHQGNQAVVNRHRSGARHMNLRVRCEYWKLSKTFMFLLVFITAGHIII